MSLYILVRSTHVFAMLLTVVLTIAVEPVFLSAIRAHSIAEVEQRYRLARRMLQFAQLTTLVGLLAAVGLVIIARWNPLAPWLLTTYGLLVLMSVIGRMGTAWQQDLQSALQSSGGGVVTADIRAQLADRRALLARWAVIVIFLTIIAVMRAKPSFGL